MKRFIRNIIVFFTAIVLVDTAFGCFCRYLCSHAIGGETRNCHFIAKECRSDVLVLGSSRAAHHYNPSVLEDSLGMSCYNCGVDGNGIVLHYGRLQMMLDRYVPKVIIYDIYSEFDVMEGDNSKYLGLQKRFFDVSSTGDVFDLVDSNEKYKLWSNMYRYNGDFVQMMADNIHPIHEVGYGGWLPVDRRMTYEPSVSQPCQISRWDAVKKECFGRFINLCRKNGIRLILTYSPYYGGTRPECDSLVHKLTEQYCLDLIDYYSHPAFCLNKGYFYDSHHMNETGATEFTREMAHRIKAILENEEDDRVETSVKVCP